MESLDYFKKLQNVLLLILVLFFVFPLSVEAQEASFYLSPSQGSYNIGRIFSVRVMVNTDGAAINASQAIVHFPVDKLAIQSISRSNSIFGLWVQEPSYSNSKGTIDFGGGLPSPGFTGNGEVFRINFSAKSLGQAKVYFGSEKILANNARGTNIFSSSSGGTYSINKAVVVPPKPKVPAAPKISSPTHSQSTEWYQNNKPEFLWELDSDIIGTSIAFNQRFLDDPGSSSIGRISSKSYQGVKDGIWYFHARLENDNGWGEIANREIRIDTTPPFPFEITVDNEGDVTNPQPLLYFKAQDETSGINHYKVKIGDQEVFTLLESQVDPCYKMPLQIPGEYLVRVEAIDNAGNSALTSIKVKIESIPVTEITVWPNTFVSGEEVLHIEGIATPDQTVIVYFERGEDLAKKWEISSDSEGHWFINEDGLFKSGEYEISAITKDSRGAVSDPSVSRTIIVILNGIAIGSWIISCSWLLLLLIILFIILCIFSLYIFRKIKLVHKTIEEETEDLKIKFYKEYNELKIGIKKELAILKEKRELTTEEKQRHQRLLKDLTDIEEVIIKELKDIEEIK